MLDVYDKAKIHGQNFQRKKWVQVTFEYTFYLLILCFIYFVLVGRPIWNGAVWYLYWVVNNKFTIAGTWSITIGLALLYVSCRWVRWHRLLTNDSAVMHTRPS